MNVARCMEIVKNIVSRHRYGELINLKREWIEFHKKHAKLVIIPKQLHRKINKLG